MENIMHENIIYRVADVSWGIKSTLGNHRFIVEAPEGEYVRVTLPWRRRDKNYAELGIRIRYGERADGVGSIEIRDIIIESATKEECTVVFRAPVSGEYELYYMPYIMPDTWYSPQTDYFYATAMTPDAEWVSAFDESKVKLASATAYEARTEFDSFYPMEVVMTKAELDEFTEGDAPFITVAESRMRQVRTIHELPAIWCGKTAEERLTLTDTVCKNEHYAFQVAVYAKEALEDIKVHFTDKDGNEYPLENVICFNTDGVDTEGKEMKISRDISAGDVLPLWCGVKFESFNGDTAEIYATVSAKNTEYTETVKATFSITAEELIRNGDDEPWRMGRLFWLNSDIGITSDVIPPYEPVKVDEENNTVSVIGRRIDAGVLGIPTQVTSFFDDFCLLTEGTEPIELFNSPVTLDIRENGEKCEIVTEKAEWVHDGTMTSRLITDAVCGDLKVNAEATYDADGHMDFMIKLTASKAGKYSFDLTAPINDLAAPYMMGMCRMGGAVPSYWDYRWNKDLDGNVVWFGGARAGVQFKLMQEYDFWQGADPLPRLWANEGRGVVKVKHNMYRHEVNFSAATGDFDFAEGQSEILHFHMLISPFHEVNREWHYGQHYYHKNVWNSTEILPDLNKAKELGCHTVILHQGGPLNENINYPFHLAPGLKKEVDRAHEMGLRYKIYYTVRELSNFVTEMWALRSLGDEIFYVGPHWYIADAFAITDRVSERPLGGPWLVEHLVENFTPAWHQFLQNGEFDCAIKTQSKSRWHNYYLKGLDWLIRVVGIDGIYLDGIGYDRHIMRRVKRVMLDAKPTCDIDIHNGNEHGRIQGNNVSNCIYMEHFPYADSLWNGEGFDCQINSPESIFTEICGLPFGVMNEMLEGGGNPFRGMLYGMTARCGWSQGGTSTNIWRAVWEPFGIKDAKMYGYWHPECPVATECDEVKATAYINRDGDVLICLGSWFGYGIDVNVNIDKEALGITGSYELYAPAIKEMKPYDRTMEWQYGDLSTPEDYLQEERTYAEGEPIHVEGGQGLMLFLRRK